jgi:hypothetical protein
MDLVSPLQAITIQFVIQSTDLARVMNTFMTSELLSPANRDIKFVSNDILLITYDSSTLVITMHKNGHIFYSQSVPNSNSFDRMVQFLTNVSKNNSS